MPRGQYTGKRRGRPPRSEATARSPIDRARDELMVEFQRAQARQQRVKAAIEALDALQEAAAS